jgi:hypothetical protein
VSLVFVVSSGRAGSTLLSQILHEHPDVLSVSEFFACLQGVLRRMPYPSRKMTGERLWQIMSAPDPVADALVRDGLRAPEMVYPYESGRFGAATGIPIICHSTLPLLTDDPDSLFDSLAAEVPGWPERPAADQYRALLAHLAGLLGRRVIVERSGGSVILIQLLRSQFPEARFVHMYRDGPDCALSMSRFPMFQLGAVTLQAALDAGLSADSTWREIQNALPQRYAGLLSPPYDMTRLAGFRFPVGFFGELWSDMMRGAVAALAGLPGDAWTTLGYEDLLADPAAELARLAAFLGVPAAPAWLSRARALIDAGRAGKASRLDEETLTALRAACQPGVAALADQAALAAG